MGQTRGSWEVSEMGSTCCHSAMSLGIPGPCASSLPHQSGPGHLQELLWTKYRIVSCSIKSDSLRPHGLEPTRLLYSWNFPGKNTGVGCHFPLQGIFLTQGSKVESPAPPALQADSLPLSHRRSPSDANHWVSKMKVSPSSGDLL